MFAGLLGLAGGAGGIMGGSATSGDATSGLEGNTNFNFGGKGGVTTVSGESPPVMVSGPVSMPVILAVSVLGIGLLFVALNRK